tara:strand:+ start:3257 stop:3547 length:291 start_codon:yes stop_codon:yes gene_type:complete
LLLEDLEMELESVVEVVLSLHRGWYSNLGPFYTSRDALDVVEALSGRGVDGDGAVSDKLDGVDGCKESCVGQDNFADSWEKRAILESMLLKRSQCV